jgi:hypothetical protein
MSLSSLNASANPLSYLTSLFGAGNGNSGSSGSVGSPPLSFASLGAAGNSGSSAGVVAPASGPTSSPFAPSTLWALISTQGQQSGGTAGSPTASQPGVGAAGQLASSSDPTLAATEATNGAADQNPLTTQQSHHGHHHHRHGGGTQGSGNGSNQVSSLLDILTSADQGATGQSAASATGSTASSDASSAASISSTPSNQNTANLMEQLIQMQAQLLRPSSMPTVITV